MYGAPPQRQPGRHILRKGVLGLILCLGLAFTVANARAADNPQPAVSPTSPELEQAFAKSFHSFYPYADRRGMIPFALLSETGQPSNLSVYKGKVVLLHFWATWCPPCIRELPGLNTLAQQKSADTRFAVVPIALDFGKTATQIREVMAKNNVNSLPVFTISENDKSWEILSGFSLPTSFLIGPDGQVLYKMVGDTDWSSPASLSFINQLIASHGTLTAQQK